MGCFACFRPEAFNCVQKALHNVYIPDPKTIWTYLVLDQEFLMKQLRKTIIKLLWKNECDILDDRNFADKKLAHIFVVLAQEE